MKYKVQDLIEELKNRNPDDYIAVWDGFGDTIQNDIKISTYNTCKGWIVIEYEGL